MTEPSLDAGWEAEHLEIRPLPHNGENYPCGSGALGAIPLGTSLSSTDNEPVVVQASEQQRVGRRAGTLPRSRTLLVGRDAEIATGLRLLGGGQRLLTLVGPAGVGKTRLALAIAEAAFGEYAHNVVFVSLAPIGDPSLVPALVAAAFELPESADADLVAALGARLGSERVLLVLDNFEHVLSAATVVSELLVECPGLSALVTSRSPLMLIGEHLAQVPPLGLPDRMHYQVEDLARCDAVQLFVSRAAAACGEFNLTVDNAMSVADVCRRLDGLPLAIELAAARLRVLPPQALLERLDGGLPLLSGGARDAPARLRSMRDAIAWSYELMSPNQRALFRRLGVFAGGWSLDMVQPVCMWDMQGHDVLEELSALLDQNLIRRTAGDGPDPRYQMLHVVREFAAERLAADGELRRVQRACGDNLGQLARRVGASRGAERERGHLRISEEMNNIRAILSWSLSGDAEPADVDLALELAGDLWFYWIHYTRAPGEARVWLARALKAAPASSIGPRAKALVALGALEWRQGDYAPARQHLHESAEIFRQLNDAQGLGYALHLAGHVHFEAREYPLARELYQQSRAALAEAGDVVGDLPLIGDLGMVAYHTGEYETAREWFERCLRGCREHGVRDHAADSLNRLGDLARLAGDLSRAEALYNESLALWRSVSGNPGIASSLHKLAQTARRRGNVSEAGRLLSESLELQTEIGNKQGIVECLAALAGLALEWAPAERAVELLAAAEVAVSQLGAPLAPADAVDFERDRSRGQASLDTSTWAAAYQRGSELTVNEALTLAQAPPASTAAKHGSARGGVLSSREIQVVELIAKGLSNREIAQALVISDKTAANHVEHIMTKLDLRSRAQVAVWAVQQHAAAQN
jgi:predicted ATPase/DNA-binding CsgD family transcriptional regulator/Tfp pilus assembly protein PilF